MIESLVETGHIYKRSADLNDRYNKYLEGMTEDEKQEHLTDDVFVRLSINQLLNVLSIVVENVIDYDWPDDAKEDIEQTVHRFLNGVEDYLDTH